MAKENVKKDEERLEQIESTLGKTEMFIEENKKAITIAVVAVVVIVLAIFGIKKFVMEPREEAAAKAMFHAERSFENDDYATALNGDGNFDGFIQIINEYGGTKSGNLAKCYAGLCYLHMEDFENAIKYLGEFNGKDMFMKPLAMGSMGDAYMELGQIAEAAACYEKAAKGTNNITTSPMYLMRAGYAYEMIENYTKALEMYNYLNSEYPSSPEGYHVLKNIAFVEAKLAK